MIGVNGAKSLLEKIEEINGILAELPQDAREFIVNEVEHQNSVSQQTTQYIAHLHELHADKRQRCVARILCEFCIKCGDVRRNGKCVTCEAT